MPDSTPLADNVLLVDDEADFARGLARLIRASRPSLQVQVCGNAQEAREALARQTFALLLTDLRMPGDSGFTLLQDALALDPTLSVVVLTAYGSIETAVQAVKAGAYDFLAKPVDQEGLTLVLDKALERTRLLRENRFLREQAARSGAGAVLIGDSPAMRGLRDTIAAVAASDYTVLVRGESGTGKELVARTIHALSRRSAKPMLSVNCPAIPEQLLESELFGHVKGAFTGADKARRGLFAAANNATLLLDEIGDIPMPVQTKLLRVLQEQEVRPVGSSDSSKVDVRIIASTNQDLEARIRARSFREDLYYRLNVLSIQVPPLRERAEDVPLLAAHFLEQSCRELGLASKELAPETLGWLAARPWPGNVRELLNFVRRLAVFAPGRSIDLPLARLADGRPAPAGDTAQAGGPVEPYKDAKERVLDDFTRAYATSLLAHTRGNVSEAARVSGLERVSLQKILRRLGLDAEGFRQG